MMDKETVSNKLRKIKELAQRGVGGEKESALALYEKLKQKYEISEDEIFDELSIHWFRYKTKDDRRLLSQVAYMVTGSTTHYRHTKSKKKEYGVECTELEAAEIKLNYDFFHHEYEIEKNMLWEAFRYKQNLYPNKDARCYKETSSTMELSEEERRKIFSFAEGIDRKAPAKAQITKNAQ